MFLETVCFVFLTFTFTFTAYAKKNAFEFGSYLKRKAEQEVVTKEEEPAKKKNKNGTSPSTNGMKYDLINNYVIL